MKELNADDIKKMIRLIGINAFHDKITFLFKLLLIIAFIFSCKLINLRDYVNKI